jgi:hypothetical protein
MFPLFSRKACLLAGIAVLTAAIPLRAGESERERELRHKLSEPVNYGGIEDARASLNDALDDLCRRYGLTFDINEKAFEMDNVKDLGRVLIAEKGGPLPALRNTALKRILRKILERVPADSGATYLIRNDVIEITTVEAIRKEFFADRPETTGPLPPLVSGAFDKVPLEAALKELNHFGNVVLDARTGKQAEAPVSADFSNVPLDTAVCLFADMAGLKAVQRDNVIYVTSKDNAQALMKEQEKLRPKAENDKKIKPDAKEEKTAPPKAAKESGKKIS